MYSLLYIFLRTLSMVSRGRFYDDFSMTNALHTMYEEGISARASGTVINDSAGAFGVYIIRYKPLSEENLDGRWN